MTVVLTNAFSQEKTLAAATRIGDELLRQAIVTRHGFTWPIAPVADGRGTTWQQPENLFSGVSGIAVFLTELYNHTGKNIYLETALGAMRWATDHCRKNPTQSYGFYAGRMGVPYALLTLHAATQNPALLEEALTLAGPVVQGYLQNPYTTNALFEGRAGVVLVLLHLHRATRAPWLLEHLAAFVDKLLDEAKYDKTGIYWDRSRNSVKGLCGFAHGAAGIGYVFSELGYYLGNDAFHAVAQQAFAYENYHWSEAQQNWPDYRKDITGADHQAFYERAYRNGDGQAFAGSFADTSWAHGAAGIGLSRLRAAGQPGDEAGRADVRRAACRVAGQATWPAAEALSPARHSLYAGRAGEGAFLLAAYRATAHAPYLLAAQAVAAHLQEHCGGGPGNGDLGLLSGRAGLGYFYIQAAFPETAPSVTRPSLGSLCEGPLPASFTDGFAGATVRKKLAAGSFPRTVQLLEAVAPQTLGHYFGEASGDWPGAARFIESARTWVAHLPEPGRELLRDALQLEAARFEMLCGINNAYLNMRELFAQDEINRVMDLSEAALWDTYFKVSEDAVILPTAHDEVLLREAGAKLNEDTIADMMMVYGHHAMLLMPSAYYHVQEHVLCLEALIINKLAAPQTVGKVYGEIESFFLPNTGPFIEKMAYFCMIEPGDKLREQFRQVIINIMKKYISLGVLQRTGAPAEAQ